MRLPATCLLAVPLLLATPADVGAQALAVPLYRVWASSADGTARALLRETTVSALTHVHPSPDGSTLAAVLYTEDVDADGVRNEADLAASALVLMDADGGHLRLLTDRDGHVDSHPTWSPDGQRIAFLSDENNTPGVFDLFVVDVDGGNRQQLTFTPNQLEADPHWGSSGWIAVARVDLLDGLPQTVWRVSEDGLTAEQLSALGAGSVAACGWATGDYDPVYDPSGERLVWARVPEVTGGAFCDFDLILRSAAGVETDLSGNDRAELMPRWSPAGDVLAFWVLEDAGGTFTSSDIWTCLPDGSQRTDITADLDDIALMPDWLPDGRVVFSGQLGTTTVSPATLDVVAQKGRLRDHHKPDRDSVRVRGTFAFAPGSDGHFDPLTEGAALEVGDARIPLAVTIAPGDAGWRVHNDGWSWRSAKGDLPRVRLRIRPGKAKFSLVIARAHVPVAQQNPVHVTFVLGDDVGRHETSWTPKDTKLTLP